VNENANHINTRKDTPFSQRSLGRPPPADLSERIWKLHRIITDPTVKRAEVKEAKRALQAAFIVQDALRKIRVLTVSKRARASSSSFRAKLFEQRPLGALARGERAPNALSSFSADEVFE
jgi:hypothetical protein